MVLLRWRPLVAHVVDGDIRYITCGSLVDPLTKEVLLPFVQPECPIVNTTATATPDLNFSCRTIGPHTTSGARGCPSCISSHSCWWSTRSPTAPLTPTSRSKSPCTPPTHLVLVRVFAFRACDCDYLKSIVNIFLSYAHPSAGTKTATGIKK
jgi:hypothetical protein